MECGACSFSQHSKGNLLYSTATAQSTMDFSPKALEDGVVDSLPSRGALKVSMKMPSALRGKANGESKKMICWENYGA